MTLATPTDPAHRIVVTAGDADIDDLGHVSNLVYVRWIQEVALAHSAAVGWVFADYMRIGATFVVRRHEIDYLSSVVRGQEIAIETWVDNWKAVSCHRHTTISRIADGQVAARARSTWAFLSWPDGKPRRMPPEIRSAFGAP